MVAEQVRLNTESVRVEDVSTPNTGRSSLRSGGSSRPNSSRRSSRGQSRVNLADKAFKGRQDGAMNLFPNPLFDNSNASLVYTDRSSQGGRSEPGSPTTRQHGGSANVRFSSGASNFEQEGWRSPERDFAVPSPRRFRSTSRRVDLPPSSYGKDKYAGAGEYANLDAQGPYTAFGVLQPACELKAGPRQDPLSKQEHVRLLAASGRIVSSLHNKIRDSPQYRQALYGTGCGVDEDYPNSWDALGRLPVSDPVAPAKTRMPPAGGFHPNLAVWGGMINGIPYDTTIHYNHQTQRMSEEERRLFLISGERHRRHADKRLARTDPMGLKTGGWGGVTEATHPLTAGSTRGAAGGWGEVASTGRERDELFTQIRAWTMAENRTQGGGYGLSVGGAMGGLF